MNLQISSGVSHKCAVDNNRVHSLISTGNKRSFHCCFDCHLVLCEILSRVYSLLCAPLYVYIWGCFLTVELSSLVLLYWYRVIFFLEQDCFIYSTPQLCTSVSSEVSGLCDVTNIRVQKCYEKEEKVAYFFRRILKDIASCI